MKENYFTERNITRKSKLFLRELNAFRRHNDFEFRPEQSALLVIDMQRFFLDEDSGAFLPAARPVIPRIKALSDAYKKNGRPVILTRHINTVQKAGMLAAWWGEDDLITADDPLSEIIPELRDPGFPVIIKTQYDAFHGTRLESLLKENEVRQVVVTGVMTHLCCETTARSAFVRGFAAFFTVDGTATQNEAFHRATLLNLSHGFAVPVLIEEILKSIEVP